MAVIVIDTPDAPKAIGPYAQAVSIGDLLFCSGQIPIDPATNEVQLFGGDVGRQTALVLNNLKAVLEAAGASVADVVKTTVYLTTMDHFPVMNAAYGAAFGAHRPARATMAVAGLPRGVGVEIDAIAKIGAGAE